MTVLSSAADGSYLILQSQTVLLSGPGSTLEFLGAATDATWSDTGTIYYTDGGTQSFTITFPNWTSRTPPAGDSLVSTTPYENRASAGPVNRPSLFAAYVPLNPAKTLEGV